MELLLPQVTPYKYIRFCKISFRKNSLYKACCCTNITFNKTYLERLGEFLSNLNNIKALDVLPYHDMAIPKYENLGIEYALKNTPTLTKDEAIQARNIIIQAMKSKNK